jgi:hypothetical protein
MKYPEYQEGRSVKTSDGERKIRGRVDNLIAVQNADRNISLEPDRTEDFPIVAWVELTDELVQAHPLVPLKESPMAWLEQGVEYWTFGCGGLCERSTFFKSGFDSFDEGRKNLGLAWRTKEECQAWISEQIEKNK